MSEIPDSPSVTFVDSNNYLTITACVLKFVRRSERIALTAACLFSVGAGIGISGVAALSSLPDSYEKEVFLLRSAAAFSFATAGGFGALALRSKQKRFTKRLLHDEFIFSELDYQRFMQDLPSNRRYVEWELKR